MKGSFLVIDDDITFCKKIAIGLAEHDCKSVHQIQDALIAVENDWFDIILLDLNLKPNSSKLEGLDYISKIKKQANSILIVVTSDEQTETVVKAMQNGADDFLRKSSFDILAWKKKFELYLKNTRLSETVNILEHEKYPFIGTSDVIEEVKKALKQLAQNPDISVLITGETGTGKEVAARFLHRFSQRASQPFVAVNISSFQEGLIESALFGHRKGAYTGADYARKGFIREADKGILFLDEVGEIPINLQVKLLRFLETKTIQTIGDEKEYSVSLQIVSATNRDLKTEIENNRFRNDLYYRLNNFNVHLPPLRERRIDINEILAFYSKNYSSRDLRDIASDDTLEKLEKYDWPGNVRELKNAIDYMFLKKRILNKKVIDIECLPENFNQPISSRSDSTFLINSQNLKQNLDTELSHTVLRHIERALSLSSGKKNAAELLGMTMDTLRYRIKKYWKPTEEFKRRYPIIDKKYISTGDL